MDVIIGMILDSATVVREQAVESISQIFHKNPGLVIDRLVELTQSTKQDFSVLFSILHAIQRVVCSNKLTEDQYTKIASSMFSLIISDNNISQDISEIAIDLLDTITMEMPEVIIKQFSEHIFGNQKINQSSLSLFDKLITNHHTKMLDTLNTDIKNLLSLSKGLNNSQLLHIITVFYNILDSHEIELDQDTLSCIYRFIVDTNLSQSYESNDLENALDILSKYYVLTKSDPKLLEYSIPSLIKLLENHFDISITAVQKIISKTDSKQLEPFAERLAPPLINNINNSEETLKFLVKSSPESVINAACDAQNNPQIFIQALLLSTETEIPSKSGFIAASSLWSFAPSHPEFLADVVELWRRLARANIDVRRLGPVLFRLAPRLPSSKLSDFQEAAEEVSKRNLIGDIAEAAFDPVCIRVAHIALSCSRASNQSVPKEFVAKSLAMSAAPFLPVQARSDSLFLLRSEPGFAEAADSISKRQCRSCAHKIVLKHIQKVAENSDLTFFLQTVQTAIHDIITATYPDTKQSVLNANEIAVFKALSFTFAVATCAIGSQQQFAKAKATAACKDVDIRSVDTIQPFVLDLEFLSKYNSILSNELYKNRLDSLRLVSDKDVARRTLVLEHDVRLTSPGKHLLELLFAPDIPKQISAHSQHRILKGGDFGDVSKHIQLIDRLLLSDDADVIKPALSSFRLLVSKGSVNFKGLQTHLKKTFGALKSEHSELFRESALEIVRKSPISVNFPNICIFIFNEEEEFSIFSCRTLLELVKASPEAEQLSLNNASSAASVCLLLKDERTFDIGVSLSHLIFRSNRPPAEFALQYFLSSSRAHSEEFIPFLFSLLCLRSPWCRHAESTIIDLARDERFRGVLEISFQQFASSLNSSTTTFEGLGRALFEIDSVRFLNALLERPSAQSTKLLAALMGEQGRAIMKIALEKEFDEKSKFHLGMIRTLKAADISEEIQQPAYIYLIRAMCFSKSLVPEALPVIRELSVRMKIQIPQGGAEEMSFVFVRALLHPLRERLSMLDLRSFEGIPFALLAGYSEIAFQGRSLLHEILQLAQKDAHSALMALPSVRALPAERYGEALIGQSVDFVLAQMCLDEESFRALLEMFDYIPDRVLMAKAPAMFESTISALRTLDPPQLAFSCISLFIDSHRFVNNPDLQRAAPTMAAIAFSFSDADSPQTVAVARTALCSLTEYLGMDRAAASVRSSLSSSCFIDDVIRSFVLDSERPFAEALVSCLSDPSPSSNIASATLCCALNSDNRFLELRAHVRLLRLLSGDCERVKIGVLKALSKFPPKI